MAELRWEWNGPSGVRVAATLDGPGGTESVFVDGALVSTSARGANPDGHVVPGRGVVSFDKASAICIFRDPDGIEVIPVKWPASTRGSAERAPAIDPKAARLPGATPRPGLVMAGMIVAAVLVVGTMLVLGYRAIARRPEAAGALSYRAPNGLFVARYPATFVAKAAVLPAPLSGLVLEDKDTGDAVVVAAAPAPASGDVAPRDVWAAQRRMHPEVLANAPRADGSFEERLRRDEGCHGAPGAVVVGRVRNRRGEPAKLWSCTFLHEGASYTAMYVTREPALPEPEARLRRVIDATELTRLEELTGAER